MNQDQSREALKDLRVLVVDDHFSTRDMVNSILRSVGFTHVAQAEDGRAALLKLMENPFDLVICDWNMPDMTGIELLERVRKDERLEGIPFLMLTAEAYRENIKEAVSLGVTDYIAKPFTAEILTNKVMKCLKAEGTG